MSVEHDVNTLVICVSFALYTLLIVGIGLYSARYARNSDEDFFLAGRSLGGWVAALSASASSESGWVTLGLVGWAFTNGVTAYWIIPGCLCGFLFNWFVVAGRMRDRSIALGALTLPDFFAFNFRERRPLLRIISVLVILLAMLLYVAAQLAAAGKAFSVTFPSVDYKVGVLIGAVVVLLYTVVGGFRAVCWTDFLQALLMVGTLVVFPIYLLNAEGGYGFISQQLGDVDSGKLLQFTPQVGGLAFFGFLLGRGALGVNFGYPGQPHVLVRFMALKDRRQARIAGVVSFIWGLFVYWGAVTVGLMARAMMHAGESWAQVLQGDEARELGLVLSAMHMLPAMMAGMVLAAVLAAICSTADSQLVVAASAAANDLYGRVFCKAKGGSNMLVNRVVVFALGIGAMLLVMDQQVQVYNYVLTYGWAILGAAFGPQVVLILMWKRASYAGCVAGMLVGTLVAIIWKLTYMSGEHAVEVYNLPLAFVAALFTNIGVSLLSRGGRSIAVDAAPSD